MIFSIFYVWTPLKDLITWIYLTQRENNRLNMLDSAADKFEISQITRQDTQPAHEYSILKF